METHEDAVLGNKAETQKAYWERLEATALGLGEGTLGKLCGSMQRRMRELATNQGDYIKRDCGPSLLRARNVPKSVLV